MGTVVVVALLVVIGVVTGLLASVVSKKEPPYGMVGDVVAATLTMVVLGLGMWYLIPIMGLPTWMRFAGTFGDPLFVAILVLWLMRRSKR
jgi:hypothetical protein